MKKKLDKPIDEIEVNDEMVVAAAADINNVLTLNPPFDLKKPGEELQKDVEELFEGIIEGDNLSEDTWKILKALGWKSTNQEQATNEKEDQSVKEKTKMETNAGEFAMAAADVQKSLAVNPPLDLNMGEEALKEELVSLLPNIQEGDDLAVTTWVTLKKLGWGEKNPVTPKAPKVAKVVSVPSKKSKDVVKKCNDKTKSKAIGRMESIGKILMTKGGVKKDSIAELADKLYAKDGGPSNLTVSNNALSFARQLLKAIDMWKEENGKISLAR